MVFLRYNILAFMECSVSSCVVSLRTNKKQNKKRKNTLKGLVNPIRKINLTWLIYHTINLPGIFLWYPAIVITFVLFFFFIIWREAPQNMPEQNFISCPNPEGFSKRLCLRSFADDNFMYKLKVINSVGQCQDFFFAFFVVLHDLNLEKIESLCEGDY